MPMINIEDAYILNETGEQVDKVTGLFTKDEDTTEEEKAFAQLNIGASGGGGGGGRNLVDNPFFTINQRGFTVGSTVGYTVDRWKNDNGSAITFSDGVIGLPANANFIQPIEPDLYAELVGKTVTLSVLYSDNTIASGTITVPSSGSTYATGTPRLAMNGTSKRFFCYPPTNISVRAFKLELGSVSTLANDAPPDYGEELAKCQRYFQRVVAPSYGNGFGFGRAHSATECRVYIPLPVPLRASPSVSITNIGSVSLAGNGNTYSCTAMAYSGRSESGVNLSFTTSGLTTNQLYLLYRSGSADVHIDLSADL